MSKRPEEKLILDDLEKSSQVKLVKVFLEKYSRFKLPLTEEGSNFLESLGIKEYVLTWKQLHDQIEEELESEDEDDQSI